MKRRTFLMGSTALVFGTPIAMALTGSAGDMDLMIHPFQGVGPLRFGMKRSKLRGLLKKKPDPNEKGHFAAKGDDVFTDLGIRIHYHPDDQICEAVTLFPPAEPRLNKRLLLGRPASELLKEMQLMDPTLSTSFAGWTCMSKGITINAPEWKTAPVKPVSSVLVFAKGYYTTLFE